MTMHGWQLIFRLFVCYTAVLNNGSDFHNYHENNSIIIMYTLQA